MKKRITKHLILIIIACLVLKVSAVKADDSDSDDDWTPLMKNDANSQMIRPITDDEFNKALNAVKQLKGIKTDNQTPTDDNQSSEAIEQAQKKEQKKFRFVPKSMQNNMNELQKINKKEPSNPLEYPVNKLLLFRIPSDLILNNAVIPTGFYLADFSKNKDDYYVILFQANKEIAKIKVFPVDEMTTDTRKISIENFNKEYAAITIETEIAKFKTFVKYKK